MPSDVPQAARQLKSFAKDGEIAAEPFHELRVRIPSDVHRQLLALKILRGVTLAQTVTIALDRFFEGRPVPTPQEVLVAAKGP